MFISIPDDLKTSGEPNVRFGRTLEVEFGRTELFGSVRPQPGCRTVRFGSAHFKSQFGSAELNSFAEPNRTFNIFAFLKIILKLHKYFLARFARISRFFKNEICFPVETKNVNYIPEIISSHDSHTILSEYSEFLKMYGLRQIFQFLVSFFFNILGPGAPQPCGRRTLTFENCSIKMQ